MQKQYDPKEIEKKWQDKWRKDGIYKTGTDKSKKKCYVLDMFPYPSGDGLHVGHPKGYISTDVFSRMKRMQGYNVLHPMGWDAFGLPAENYAIKKKMNPRECTADNIERFKKQIEILGLDYDWEREINTTDPTYYKWTQWIFLQLFKKGLAYESHEPINWCPSCKTGLSNEDVEDGKCERCSTPVEQKPMRQWVLRITAYAERMLKDLDTLDWQESMKDAERNWIGKSEGHEIEFSIFNFQFSIKVFTTRIDTLFGASYVVLAPEHKLIDKLKPQIENWTEVEKYIEGAKNRTAMDRTVNEKEKTGVEIKGIKAVNPANGQEIPVWVADYVLGSYGTGAVMAVPAHDDRDWDFALKYNLPIRKVVSPNFPVTANITVQFGATTEDGYLIDSGEFSGETSAEAREKIAAKVGAEKKTTYKLRDWVFSRQRYWGEPIPVVHCPLDGVVALDESELPLTLPPVENFEPTGTGESPLAGIEDWVNTICPTCGGPAKRETNTMPQWAGSSWYYLRYMDPHNEEALVGKDEEKYWSPVDLYVGGAEHVTRHMIYARFWHKFLQDIGAISTIEPFAKYTFVGLVMGEDGRKMSKRWGNVINPDDIVARFGADSMRLYETFMGPFENTICWSTDGLVGVRRFLERVWKLQSKVESKKSIKSSTNFEIIKNQTIKKVSEDIAGFKLNTAVSSLMILLNEAEKEEGISSADFAIILKLLAPFAPHLTEELWYNSGHSSSIHKEAWPVCDSGKLLSSEVKIAVQVGGKLRGVIEAVRGIPESEAINKAYSDPNIKKWLTDGPPKKVVFVPDRLLNIVT